MDGGCFSPLEIEPRGGGVYSVFFHNLIEIIIQLASSK